MCAIGKGMAFSQVGKISAGYDTSSALWEKCGILESYLNLQDHPVSSLASSISQVQVLPQTFVENLNPTSTWSSLGGRQDGDIFHSETDTEQVPGFSEACSPSSFAIPLTQSNGGAKYFCSDCNRAFPSSSNYGRHMREKHTKIRHKCQLCGKSYSRMDYSKRHTCKPRSGQRTYGKST